MMVWLGTMTSADFSSPLSKETSHGKRVPFLYIEPDLPDGVTEGGWASQFIA